MFESSAEKMNDYFFSKSVLFLSTTKDKRAELPFQPDNLND